MNEQQPSDSYRSIEAPSKGLYKESGSKFLSFAYPVTTELEVKEILDNIKKEYFDARHHCFAYRIGQNGEEWRLNDDKEPSSSAGRPIYGQLLSNELSDVLIVVVRYFGGTKLGIPGLIRAYRSAASDAIDNATIITKISSTSLNISFDYTNIEPVMKLIKSFDANIIKQEYDTKYTLLVIIRNSSYHNFTDALTKVEGVEIE